MALIDNLISYWKCDEASGDLLDAHGSNDLTDTNTVGSATGIINNGRDYEKANSEYHTIADNADLSFGDEDFSLSLWINPESLTASTQPFLIGKGRSNWGATSAEYVLRINGFTTPNHKVDWSVLGTSGFADSTATTSSAISAGTWYHIVVYHDSVGNEIGIIVDDGTPVTDAHTAGCWDSTHNFSVGADTNGANHFDGIVDEIGIWDKVLSSSEITDLYNSGNGLAYPFSVSSAIPRLMLLGAG